MTPKLPGLCFGLLALFVVSCSNPTVTTSNPDKAITLLAIPGITAPARAAVPDTTDIDTAQYTGTLSWSPAAETFAANTEYTATIVLTAKAGWTLNGVPANSFTVTGATVTHAVNSGTVTALFPETADEPDEVISLLAIPGVTAPVRGATPVTTDIETEQYTATLSWSPEVTDNFAVNTVYTANIIITAKDGWTLNDLAANTFTVTGAMVTHAANSGIVTALFPATEDEPDQVITLLAIPGIVAPVTGAMPVTTAIDTAQYTGTLSWFPRDYPFASNKTYAADIVLTPKTGWTLTGVAADSFTVAGAIVTHGINSGTVTAVFPSTAITVAMLAIPGVTAPVTGVTPVTTAIDTEAYTGTITWSPTVSSTFAASTVYTANIALNPKTGYTLTGVAANSFTVAGATVTHAVNSGAVAAVFPATAAVPITLLAIPGVTAPVRGDTPVTTAINTTQYTGTISWSPTVSSTFAASTVYTANIALTPKTGWTLTGVTANSFTVAGATVTHAAGSGTVAAVFPITFGLDYSSANIGTLKFVPVGRFQRDATATNISVITNPYRMSAHEITRAQFSALLTTDPSNATYSSGTSDPVQMTNWYHAIAFCNKLSLAEGLTPVYTVSGVNFSTLTYAAIPTTDNATWNAVTATWTNNGYRLPTEMEWMWAAMGAPADGQGGGTNTTGYAKAFAGSTGSNAIGVYAVYGYNSGQTGATTTQRSNPVGSKTTGANELGLYDMSGNVWECTWDRYGLYPTGTLTDYLGAASGTNRVLRGGSWNFNASCCTVAHRFYYDPNLQDYFIGFRVVRP